MNIIPSIDLQNGNCVRLTQGDFGRVSKYSLYPEKVACKFSNFGASVLHVVDLDGAKDGLIAQLDCIKSIRNNFKQVMQVGGGIRTESDIDNYIEIGVDRVVIGSAAILNKKRLTKWLEKYGADVIVLAMDFIMRDGVPYVAIKGWQEKTNKTVWDVLKSYPTLQHVLCTDISKDGMQKGPNLEFYQEIKTRYPKLKVQASGGVSCVKDILDLKKIQVESAIIGKALYEGEFNLKEAMACSNEE